ncbi:hypothetical protein [Pseudomonas syringae]|uniref:hypothetical protein n=1 Tax=Pseudomonas syringae TaxID=317 RepID=UPI0007EE7595|nr:hypothetical protein [Pseudomonas syringae]OBS34040.1 hypothetical protein A9K81_15125 [Pseudomonas syringae pv. syringae]
MSVKYPFYRTVRELVVAPNSGYSSWAYIIDKDYARSPQHFIRAYLLIQKDLSILFEYVEPSDHSATAYSYRIHELLMRTCIEIEANFKAILFENGYVPELNRFDSQVLNMRVYRKVNVSHHLSSYEVSLPIWSDGGKTFTPYKAWATNNRVEWYEAYNLSKHNRHEAFKLANFETLVNAVAGLLVLLTAQFKTETFSAGSEGISVEGYDYHSHEAAIGDLFRVKYPEDWSEDELYDFDWSVLSQEQIRFAKFDYNK